MGTSWRFDDWLKAEARQAELWQRWRDALELPHYQDEAALEAAQAGLWSLLVAVAQAEGVEAGLLDGLEPSPGWGDWLAIAGLLPELLFERLADEFTPQEAVERWRQVGPWLTQLLARLRTAYVRQVEALEAEQEHLEALNTISSELSASLDLAYVLQRVINYIVTAAGADCGAVLVVDQETQRAVPRAGADWSGESVGLGGLPEDWLQGRGEPLLLASGGPNPPHPLAALLDNGTETMLVAPLNANGQFHGMLILASARPEGFDERQRRLIQSATDQVAAAVGNAEIYRFLNDQARELGQMLRQQQEEASKSQAMLASIADGVVVNDTAGKIILVNPAAERILGVSASKLMGEDPRSLFELFAAGEREVALEAMTALLAGPGAQSVIGADEFATQATLETKDRVVSANLAPVQSRQGEFLGIVTVFRDITKEFEADRAKSEFVSTVSHELRTPMTAIKGYTDLLASQMGGQFSQEQRKFLNIIKNNTDRLTALINDLLDISRVESGRVRFEPRMIQAGDIVQDVVEVLRGQAEAKGHSLTCTVPDDLPVILADADRLTQVLTNLVSNAIHYTPPDGQIRVDVYGVTDALRIDVSDNGVGIPREELPRIFERFYRGDHPMVQESRGTGLGLPIAKMFVEMHGGRMWVESEAGQGSTFTVLLPLPMEEQPDQDLARSWFETAAQLDKPTILLADDDRDIVELLRLRLEGAGYQVVAVGGGEAALENVQRYRPDLVIVDVLLPDMNGLDVLRGLKGDPSVADIPVLIFSVVEDDGSAVKLGAAGFLSKSISEPELLAEVRSALARRARVLIVEDESDMVDMIEAALRRVGFAVAVAANGYDAMSIARSWSPQAIVLDLHLPGMDGFEVLSHLKRDEVTQDIPVLAVSGRLTYQEAEEKELIRLGAASFLSKPFSISHLLDKLDLVLLGY